MALFNIYLSEKMLAQYNVVVSSYMLEFIHGFVNNSSQGHHVVEAAV